MLSVYTKEITNTPPMLFTHRATRMLFQDTHFSGDSETVVMTGWDGLPKKKLAHQWPGSDFGRPVGQEVVIRRVNLKIYF